MAPRVAFPLPDHYFRPVELTRRDEEQFQDWAMALVQESLHGFHKDQYLTNEQRERKWKPLKQRGALTAFRRRKGTEEEDDEYRYLCSGKIDGSLDEIMLGRYADSTESFRRMSAVYREDLVDCMVLHVIEKQSRDKPYFFSGFKWMTVKSPGKGLVKNRDVCWFEQSGLTRDHKGKEIGYHIAQSVDLAACPPFDDSVCVRARLSACYLFRRNKSGGTKVFMRGKNNAGGKVLDWVADQKSAELWLRTERAIDCTMAYVSTAMVRAALPLSSHLLGTNNLCEVCAEKTAGLLVSQKECSVCHRITCSRCVIKRRVLSSARDFMFVERENFCKRCVRFFHDINYRDPDSIAMACAAAASRGEPNSSSLSGHSRGYSQTSSLASSDSGDSIRDPYPSHSSGSSRSNNPMMSVRSGPSHSSSTGGGMSRVPPSPHTTPRLVRHDSARSVGSASSAKPVVLYTEAPPPPTKPRTTTRHHRAADSEATTVSCASSHQPVRGGGGNTNPYASSSQSSYASEYSYADSIDSGDASSYRDTADSSPTQSFQKHLVGSYASYNGNTMRLGSTDELSSPTTIMATTAAPSTLAMRPHAAKSYETPEDMMAQMIRMNIMAEQARQMVKENDKFTRKFNFY